MSYNVLSDSEKKKERARKKLMKQEDDLESYKRKFTADVATAWGVFYRRNLTPVDKYDTISKLLLEMSELFNRKARELER